MKTINKTYSGIGSRETPEDTCKTMTRIASLLEEKGYHLRSGGAKGADESFERGVKNERNKTSFGPNGDIPEIAFEIASKFHPVYYKLSPYVKRLMARNSQILLGELCDEKSDFVICWTPGGNVVGGTGQGLRIAKAYDIKVYNLFNKSDYEELMDFVEDNNLIKFTKNEIIKRKID